jgi:hypothetical protein
MSHTEGDLDDVWFVRMHMRYHTPYHPVKNAEEPIYPTYSTRPVNFRIFDMYLEYLQTGDEDLFTKIETIMQEDISWQEKRS